MAQTRKSGPESTVGVGKATEFLLTMGKVRFISIRKLAALDLEFHGARFVVTEFAGGAALAGLLAALSLRSGLWGAAHPIVWEIALGAWLASIAVNYLPLLTHALALIRSGSARQEVADELDQSHVSERRYGTQQFLLLVPFAVLALAIAQTLLSDRDGPSPGR